MSYREPTIVPYCDSLIVVVWLIDEQVLQVCSDVVVGSTVCKPIIFSLQGIGL
jgi:hypothetical protein